MTERAAGKHDFSDVWRRVSKLCDSTTQDKKTHKRMLGSTSPVCRDIQSPKGGGYSRYPGLNNGDSPGDVEPSQDIFWDPTSPPAANTGHKNTRVVEISDIVNRIAPKDVKRKGVESPLLQWIGDSAIACTPDVPRSRAKKKSSRQNRVEDLVRLARQFDRNMQQDSETSAERRADTCDSAAEAELAETSVSSPKCPSLSDGVEAELNALFDCSTQKVSGRLSQGSSASAPSQEPRDQPVTSAVARSQQPMAESAVNSGPDAHPDLRGDSRSVRVDAFDDDWENDDLLNDPFVLAMTQNPHPEHAAAPKATLKPDAKASETRLSSEHEPSKPSSAHRPSSLHSKPRCSTAQEPGPKRKPTGRSTFLLEPLPQIQPKMASDSSFTVIQPKRRIYEQKPAAAKTPSTPRSESFTSDPKDSVKDAADSLWDDGNDDALLYQVCDIVERISNTQPQPGRPQKQSAARETQRGTTAPLPIDTTRSVNAAARASRQPPCAFVRSNSLPGTGCEDASYQGWSIPMKGANANSRLSQSLPGSRTCLGTFHQRGDSPGTVQTVGASIDVKPVAARGRPSGHAAFKRNASDTAVMSSKVFVTSQVTGKCSAAEIERKKREALARRRLRMQNVPKS